MRETIARAIVAKTKKDYNHIVSKFSATRQYPWTELEPLKRYVASGDHILDVGCGNGRLLKIAFKRNVSYTGFDISDKLINQAKINFPHHTFVEGDLTRKLPFSDNAFDVIFCVATMHHIPSASLRHQSLQEMYRVLKPKGCLIFSNWNLWQQRWWPLHLRFYAKKLIGRNKLDLHDVFKPWKDEQGRLVTERYLHAFSKKELASLFRKNGFSVAQQYYTKKGSRTNWLQGYNLISIAHKP